MEERRIEHMRIVEEQRIEQERLQKEIAAQ